MLSTDKINIHPGCQPVAPSHTFFHLREAAVNFQSLAAASRILATFSFANFALPLHTHVDTADDQKP